MRIFPARFTGYCGDGSECDGEFEPGEMVGYDESDELCCRACLSAQRSEVQNEIEDSGWFK